MTYYVLRTVHSLDPSTTDMVVDGNSTLAELNAAHMTADNITEMMAVMKIYIQNNLLHKYTRERGEGTSLVTNKYFSDLADAQSFLQATESYVYQGTFSITEITDAEFDAVVSNVDFSSMSLLES